MDKPRDVDVAESARNVIRLDDLWLSLVVGGTRRDETKIEIGIWQSRRIQLRGRGGEHILLCLRSCIYGLSHLTKVSLKSPGAGWQVTKKRSLEQVWEVSVT